MSAHGPAGAMSGSAVVVVLATATSGSAVVVVLDAATAVVAKVVAKIVVEPASSTTPAADVALAVVLN